MTTILGFETYDVRFPTSRMLDGSDAMNPDPDYSAAALILRTDAPDGAAGHAHVFTIGRGNEIQLTAIQAFEPFLAGLRSGRGTVRSGRPGPAAGRRQPAPVAGPGTRRGSHGHRGGTERVLGSGRPARGQATVAAAGGTASRGDRLPGGFQVPQRRAHPRRRAGTAGARCGRAGRAHRGPAGRGLPGLHHHPRLAGLLRRAARAALRGSRRRRLHPGQAKSRRPPRG